QAEDGIRDWSVTGVQTCALPISARPLTGSGPSPGSRVASSRGSLAIAPGRAASPAVSLPVNPESFYLTYINEKGSDVSAAWLLRSEEHTSELQSLTNLVCRLLLE